MSDTIYVHNPLQRFYLHIQNVLSSCKTNILCFSLILLNYNRKICFIFNNVTSSSFFKINKMSYINVDIKGKVYQEEISENCLVQKLKRQTKQETHITYLRNTF